MPSTTENASLLNNNPNGTVSTKIVIKGVAIFVVALGSVAPYFIVTDKNGFTIVTASATAANFFINSFAARASLEFLIQQLTEKKIFKIYWI